MTTVKPGSRHEHDRGVLSGKVDEPLTAALPAFFTFAAGFGGDPWVTQLGQLKILRGRAGGPAFVAQRLTSCIDHKNAPESNEQFPG